MAKQKGIFKVKGTLGDVSFYKSKDGYLVREKTSLDGTRISKDPAFARTRENGREFARAAQSGKQLRLAFRQLLKLASDSRVTSRLTQQMMVCLHQDETHERGERTVADHISFLKGFDFNINGHLSSTVYFPYEASADRASGQMSINIETYRPTGTILAPSGTTHYQLHVGAALVDFATQSFESGFTETALIPFDTTEQAANALSVTLSTGSTASLFICFGITFSQEVNGSPYSLKNGAYNALGIVLAE